MSRSLDRGNGPSNPAAETGQANCASDPLKNEANVTGRTLWDFAHKVLQLLFGNLKRIRIAVCLAVAAFVFLIIYQDNLAGRLQSGQGVFWLFVKLVIILLLGIVIDYGIRSIGRMPSSLPVAGATQRTPVRIAPHANADTDVPKTRHEINRPRRSSYNGGLMFTTDRGSRAAKTFGVTMLNPNPNY